MKKYSLLILIVFCFLLSGCIINYNIAPDTPSTPSGDSGNNDDSSNDTTQDIIIGENELFYPSSLTIEDPKITEYTYIDANLTSNYKIYSAYYSDKYDTIYIAYDLIDSPIQTLKAKDLHEIEMHAVNYFVSDTNRSEDKNYLKAVRIYPDRLASACRKGQTDDVANSINGCADYGGKEAIIDLNNTSSLDDFYNEKRTQISPTKYSIHEPMRDTFAHEYGHVSTFYHMVYKNDENYEDYLKLRLQDYYEVVYENGILPGKYSSSQDYRIQPEEILADDFVELFYNTTTKLDTDTREYTLEYSDSRNSLGITGCSSIQYLKENQNIANTLKQYYQNNFLNYDNKITYDKPIIISSNSSTINYYESVSKIGNTTNLKTITSLIDVNLIAVGELTTNNTKYYRVILSSTSVCPNNSCDLKDVGEKMGYVEATQYTTNNTLKLYSINKGEKNHIFPIEDNETNNLFIVPFYDFSYVLNTTNNTNYATMYDYLSEDLPTQTFKINIYSFGTLIE